MVKPLIVCHQLRSADNLGAIARVLANFGLNDLVLSDQVTHDFRGAERLGVGGDAVLEHFAVAPTLAEAVSACVYVVGTTSREKLKRFTPLSPEQGVAKLAEHAARGKVALVLGGEKRGLSDDELALCQDVIVIPTPGPQPSMNISHAAAVLAYLCAGAGAPPATGADGGAPQRTLHALEEVMREALLACEFLNPQAPEHVLKELSRSLVHGHLSEREAHLWRSAFEHVLRTAKKVTSPGAGR